MSATVPIDSAPLRRPRSRFAKSGALRFVEAQRRGTIAIPPFLQIAADDWRAAPEAFLCQCRQHFPGVPLAVRSDAWAERSTERAHAGEFRTLLDVATADLPRAIDRVVSSLPGHPADGVIVQAMVQGIVHAGVAATHRIDDGAPYYTLELAPLDSAAVTAGRAVVRQVALSRAAVPRLATNPALGPDERAAFALLREIELLYGSIPLEIELALALDHAGVLGVHLLQVRALSTRRSWPAASGRSPRRLLPLDFLVRPDPVSGIVGQRTVLSLMSDWNPAELIGAHPRPLARSIFEHVIARGAWLQARADLGYRALPVDQMDLLRIVHGRPYVDVRRSANSLLPDGLAVGMCATIVDASVERLRARPMLHDKVEFAVLRTVRDFEAASAARRNWSELDAVTWIAWDRALLQLSRRLMDLGPDASLPASLAALARLDATFDAARPWRNLLDLGRRAARAFAALARMAFAAEMQLRSAVARGALTSERAGALRATARRASTSMCDDAAFDLAGHGHLRAGMFDITCPPSRAILPPAIATGDSRPFALDAAERAHLAGLLSESEFSLSPEEWLRFVQASAWAREHGKYAMGRFVSAALDRIGALLAAVGLDLECASWLTVDDIASGELLPSRARPAFWSGLAREAAERHRDDGLLMTSSVLCDDADRDVARTDGVLPNFVGNRAVDGPIVRVSAHEPANAHALRGAVAAISHADPGYDWLFATGIAGLVTAWGGANSHLAIRCAEIGATAALGCGDAVFARVVAARRARIDPGCGGIWLE